MLDRELWTCSGWKEISWSDKGIAIAQTTKIGTIPTSRFRPCNTKARTIAGRIPPLSVWNSSCELGFATDKVRSSGYGAVTLCLLVRLPKSAHSWCAHHRLQESMADGRQERWTRGQAHLRSQGYIRKPRKRVSRIWTDGGTFAWPCQYPDPADLCQAH